MRRPAVVWKRHQCQWSGMLQGMGRRQLGGNRGWRGDAAKQRCQQLSGMGQGWRWQLYWGGGGVGGGGGGAGGGGGGGDGGGVCWDQTVAQMRIERRPAVVWMRYQW